MNPPPGVELPLYGDEGDAEPLGIDTGIGTATPFRFESGTEPEPDAKKVSSASPVESKRTSVTTRLGESAFASFLSRAFFVRAEDPSSLCPPSSFLSSAALSALSFFSFSFFRRRSSANLFRRRARFFRTSSATALASSPACASYLLSNASMVTARNRVRKVYLPTITQETKKKQADHPAYATLLNMMNSQSSRVNTWNTVKAEW